MLKYMGVVISNSKPYVGVLDMDNKKIISCVWIDTDNEVSIITHEDYRRLGLMKKLIRFMKKQVILNKLKEIKASPINSISRRIFKKARFKRCEMPGYYSYSK